MRTALYARVSTERQERRQTIASQLTALQARAVAGGYTIAAEHIFCDEGCIGQLVEEPAGEIVACGAEGCHVELFPGNRVRMIRSDLCGSTLCA